MIRKEDKTVLKLENVTKSFGSHKALDALTMSVPKGAVYGLVGPNGAGKTTAIRIITGVYRPDSGSVTMGGVGIYENPALKQCIGYIPDDIFHFPSASLEDMRRFYRGIYRDFDDALFEKLCAVFQLSKKGQLRRLSKGMLKQAAFQLTLCIRPDLLVLDEPVDGLDPVMRRQVWELLQAEVTQREMTVLLSSHNLRELEDVCTHVGIMDRGKLLLQRSLADMQGNTVKLQLVGQLPEGLEVLRQSQSGKLSTYVIRGSAESVTETLKAAAPTYFDVLPLSLEETFIFELGGVSDEAKNSIL